MAGSINMAVGGSIAHQADAQSAPGQYINAATGLVIVPDDNTSQLGYAVGPDDHFTGLGSIGSRVINPAVLQNAQIAAVLDKYIGYGVKLGVFKDTEGNPWLMVADGPTGNRGTGHIYDWDALLYTYSPPRNFSSLAGETAHNIVADIRQIMGIRAGKTDISCTSGCPKPDPNGWNVIDGGNMTAWDDRTGWVYGVEFDFPPVHDDNGSKVADWDGRMVAVCDRFTRVGYFYAAKGANLTPIGGNTNMWYNFEQFILAAIKIIEGIISYNIGAILSGLEGLAGIATNNLTGFGDSFQGDTGIPNLKNVPGIGLIGGLNQQSSKSQLPLLLLGAGILVLILIAK